LKSCYGIFKCVFYFLFRVYTRLEIFSKERVPEEGGVLVIANHASYLDPGAVGVSLRRRATFIARENLWEVPLLGRFVAAFAFPVKREGPMPSTVKEAVKRLRAGEVVVMFPQGTRTPEGSVNELKRGVSLIARLSGAAVVPVLLRGTERALPLGGRFIRPAKITVRFGEPVKIKEGQKDEEFIAELISAFRRLAG